VGLRSLTLGALAALQAAPSPSGPNQGLFSTLSGVSCPTASVCTAVGNTNGFATTGDGAILVERFLGSAPPAGSPAAAR
jgi:hypothetical protein